jgi:toxin CcdB
MAQFDVHVNPISAARRAYPLVVILQCDLAKHAPDVVVAPLVLRKSIARVTGRLTPIARLAARDYVVLIPALTGVRARDLGNRVDSLATSRSELLAAVDYLFFGV